MRETAKTLAGQGVTYALQLAFLVLVARLLGPDGQGEFALLRTATYLTEPMLWLGLTSGMPYLVARDSSKYHDPLLKAALGYLVVAIAVITVGLQLISRYSPSGTTLGIVTSHQVTFIVWLGSLAVLQLLQRTFIGQRRFAEYNRVWILNAAVAFPALLGFSAREGVTVAAATQACIVANVIALVYALWAHRAHLDSALRSTAPVLAVVREAYAIGLKGYVSAIAFLVLYRLDFFFVAHFLGTRTLGVYAVAVFVVEAVQKVPDWLSLMLTPQVAAGRDTEGQLTRRYLRGALGSVAALGAVIAAMALWLPAVFDLVFGQGYENLATVLLLLLPRVVVHAVMVTHAAYLAGSGYPLYHPLAGLVGLGVLCGVDVYAIPRYGLNGAVAGMMAAYIVAAAVMVWGSRVQRRVHVVAADG